MRFKGILCGLITIAVGLALVDSFFISSKTVKYSKPIVSIIKNSRTEGELQFESFDIDACAVIQDNKTGVFYCSMPDLAMDTSWVPVISIDSGNSDIKVAIDSSHLTRETIEKNEPISMLMYNDEVYYECELIVTTLPILNVEFDAEPIFEQDSDCSIELYDNRNGLQYAERRITSGGVWHARGATSQNFAKKAYKISLKDIEGKKNDVDLLGLRKDDDWILYPAYNDAEMVRNVFSTNLWTESCGANNQWGIKNGTEYRYIELFNNGSYAGLYALGYPVDNKLLEIDDKEEKEFLFACKKIMFSFENLNKDAEGESNYEGPVNGFELKGYGEKSGDSPAIYWESLRKYLGSTYENENISDAELLSMVDINNAVDIWLFSNLIQSVDQCTMDGGDMVNYYISVKFEAKSASSKILYTPWDLDLTWGNIRDGNEDTKHDTKFTIQYALNPEDNQPMDCSVVNILLQRNNDYIWDLVLSRYSELRQNMWSDEHISELLDGYQADIVGSGAYEREQLCWPNGIYSENEDVRLGEFKDYVLNRLDCFDEYINRLANSRGEDILLQRLAQYDDLDNSTIIIELNDQSVLEDKEICELLEFWGFKVEDITAKDNILIRDGGDGSLGIYEMPYFDGGGGTIGTVSGEVSVERLDHWYDNEGCCSLMLGSYEVSERDPYRLKTIRVNIVNKYGVSKTLHLDNFYSYDYKPKD